MKYLLSLLFALSVSCIAWSQAPAAFKYQAVVRNAAGQVRADQSVTLAITIRRGAVDGPAAYAETHDVTTNAFGLVNLEIGRGTSSDDLAAVDWAAGPYFINVSVDGNDMGASQLLSVPYASYAERAGNTFSGDYNDLSNAPDLSDVVRVGAAQAGNLISYDGNNWIAKDLVLSAAPAGGNQPFDVMQPFLAVNYCIALQGVFPSRNSADPLLGEIMLFAGNFAPRGWAFCDGSLLSIAQNTALFSLLGTTYGGDGRTTFGLPDLRGRVPMHAGNGPGLTPRNLGERSGAETRTLNMLQLPSHTHVISQQ